MMTLAIGGLIIFAIIALISIYNKLVHLRALTDEGWSGVEVQLKRRYDLVPNLISVARQYAAHEKGVFEAVTQARAQALQAHVPSERVAAENGLSRALRNFFAVVENYPDLKANAQYMQVSTQLSSIEDELQLARRYYNGAARNYNVVVQRFPSNIVARVTGYALVPYFQLTNPAEQEVPRI